jgi:CheY-specific phosphatase CheX
VTIPRFFGQYLLGQGLVTAPQLLAAVEYQNRHNSKLGEFAVERGMATPFEVEQIRALQAKEDRLFGEAAICLQILTADQVYELLSAQKDAHLELGQALVDQGFLTREEVDQAAAQFINSENELEPEIFTLPEELPAHELLTELFYLAHKLLLRVCNLVSKPGSVRIAENELLPLSDLNMRVPVRGALSGSLLLGVPQDIATSAAGAFSGEAAPDESATAAIVREMAAILSENLASAMAERGRRLSIDAPRPLDQRMSIPPGMRVAIVPFVTHQGQVLVGVSLPAGD